MKDACSWISNSRVIAMEHYAMPTDDSFRRAARGSCGSAGGSISANQELSGDGPEMRKPSKPKDFEGAGTPVIAEVMGDTGLEVSSETKGKQQSKECVVLPVVLNDSGKAQRIALNEAWAVLDAEARQRLIEFAQALARDDD